MIRPAINYIEPSVFSKRHTFKVNGWNSIKDYHIGIVRGVGTSEDGTRGMKHVLALTTLEQLMQSLAADRIDVAVSDSFSGLTVLKQLGLENRIEVLMPPLQKNEIYHYLHEKHRDLARKVGKVILEMQSSGELELLRVRIINTYLAEPGSATRGR